MVRGYDPDKHAKQVTAGRDALAETLSKMDDKIKTAKDAATKRRDAATAADKKVTDLEADKAILQGRLDQANAVLARITEPVGADVQGDAADETEKDQESLPV